MNIISMEVQTYERITSRIKDLSAKVEQAHKRLESGNVEEWMDNQDVCLLLGICLRTLQSLRETGKVSFSRINHKIYYKREDILLLIDNYSKKK